MTRRLPAALAAVTLSWCFPGLAQEAPPPVPPEAPAPPPPTSEPTAAADEPGGAVLNYKGMELKISGVIFASWQYLLATPAPDGTNSGNGFDLTRAYINVEPRLTKNIWLRITPDLTRVRDEDGSLDGNLALRLKYAYAQFNEILPGQAIKGGLQHTAYIDFEDSMWRYRVLGPSAYELFARMSSSDLGVGVLGSVAGGVLSYQLVLSNGEGYTAPEAIGDVRSGKYKDAGLRLTARIVDGLRLTAFGQYGITSDPPGPGGSLVRARGWGLLSYESELFTVAAGGGVTRDDEPDGITRGLLLTSFGFVNLPLDFRVLGRFDHFDPDTGVDGPGTEDAALTSRAIGGVAYLITPDVQVIADVQHQGFANEDEITNPAQGTSFFVHLEAKY